jgi:hypothetical protein
MCFLLVRAQGHVMSHICFVSFSTLECAVNTIFITRAPPWGRWRRLSQTGGCVVAIISVRDKLGHYPAISRSFLA